jgi:3-oxoacyl-[acyl-carrier protein] reductase
MGWEDRTVVVTGAARGIGKEIASRFVAHKARVALVDVEEEPLNRTASELSEAMNNPNVAGFRCDISDAEQVKKTFADIRSRFGPVSVLINNAGVIRFRSLEDTTIEDWDFTMAVNLRGAFLCIKEVIADMKGQRWGKIVNIGSSAGINGGARNVGAYAVSKAGIMCLTKSLAKELAPFNINVNSVAPSLIDTRMLSGIADMASQIPIGRTGTPADVANAVEYLCDERASFIAGETLNVNGGFLIV